MSKSTAVLGRYAFGEHHRINRVFDSFGRLDRAAHVLRAPHREAEPGDLSANFSRLL